MDPDSDLIRSAARGEPFACRALVRDHGPLVYGMCRRLADDPDDCYQDVWEKVFRALPGFDVSGPAPLRGWIATITRRHLIDQHRKRRTQGEVLPLDGLASPGPSVEDTLAKRSTVAHLERALQLLPADQRHVVVQHHVHGVSLVDLAAEEGVPVGTIKSRLHRGRARLPHLLRRA